MLAALCSEFLVTRVVELALHGLDIADVVQRRAGLTPAAVELLQQTLFGADWRAAVAGIGSDPVDLLRKATARAPIDARESAQLDRWGLRRLDLG